MEEEHHGEVWQFENNISDLIELCEKVLSDNPLFFLINSYTTGISAEVLSNLLRLNLKKYKGKITSGEIGLPMKNSELILPCRNIWKMGKINPYKLYETRKKIYKNNNKSFCISFFAFYKQNKTNK